MTTTAPATEQLVAPPELLNMAETADMMHMPLATLRYLRATQRGPHGAKIGGRVMYRKADVLAWINAQFDGEDGEVA